MALKEVETNIVFTLARMLKRHWPEGTETVDGWIEAMEEIQNDNPRIGDLVVAFDKPEDWCIGVLADCVDKQVISGMAPDLRWRLKGSPDYHRYCRRLKFSDLNDIAGFALIEFHEKGENEDERN